MSRNIKSGKPFYTNIRKWGKKLLFAGYDNGKKVFEKMDFEPELFLPDDTASGKYMGWDGQKLRRETYDNMKEAVEYVKANQHVHGRKIYGTTNYPAQFIAKYFPDKVDYDLNLIRIFYLDIETWSGEAFPEAEKADYPITLLTIHDSKTGIKHVWGTQPYVNNDPMVEYYEYSLDTEVDMLYNFLAWMKMNPPDIITGWNSRLYDLMYIVNRMKKILSEKAYEQLSPWGIVMDKDIQMKRFGQIKQYKVYDIYGIADLDYMDLYQKYTPNQESSYKLDHIAYKNLKKKKVEFEGTLHELYENDYQKYVEYNIQDVQLIVELEQKLKYLALIIDFSYNVFVPSYMDCLGTTKIWETCIFHHLSQQNIYGVIKDNDNLPEKIEYAGGYVKEPNPGLYRWVMTIDVKSLYPKIIETLNIGIETHRGRYSHPISVDKLLNDNIDTNSLVAANVALSVNGDLYSRDKQSFFSVLMEKFFNQRKEYTALMKKARASGDKDTEKIYDIKQYSIKILINSFYGCLGTNFFQYYSVANAASVTLTGQYINRSIWAGVNKFLNEILKTVDQDYIVFGDTDSSGILLESIVKKFMPDETDVTKIAEFLNKFGKEYLEPIVAKTVDEALQKLNVFKNHIQVERENICDVAIWTGKKHYLMNIVESDGKINTDIKLKMKGIETVKSDTPMLCRDKLEDVLKIIVRGDNNMLIKFIDNFRKEYNQRLPQELAYSKSVKKALYEDTDKTNPINTRASTSFNKLIDNFELQTRYQKIKDGQKIKYIYLTLPNPSGENVIAFVDKLPPEFGLDKYIDFDTMFDKSFLKPIRAITDVIGWKLEKKHNLSKMFS